MDKQQTEALPRFLTKKQVLALVPVTSVSLWAWCARSEFPPPRTIGSRPMWLEAEVVAWLTSRPVRQYKQQSQSTNLARNGAGADNPQRRRLNNVKV
jgi:predicted DNA-binding transcriptional regulator AlpA